MKKGFLAFLTGCFIAALLILLSFFLYCVTPPSYIISRDVSIEIPQGNSLNDIASILERKGAIQGRFRFKVLARLLKVERRLKYGEYYFTLPESPLAILSKLARGDAIAYLVTFPEGCTMFDVAQIIENTGMCTGAEILRQASDVQLIHSLNIAGETLEGFLFPDTYKFNRGGTPEMLLRRMVDQFNKMFDQNMLTKAAQMGLSREEIVTIASLIEKETGCAEERPLIAAVFLNRLKKGMRLDCDPTVIYSLKRENPAFSERLNRNHLRKESPYNTYLNAGLPPGPICNPGLASIRAVFNPAPVKYLYFVSKNDGTHHFSESIEQHNQAVATYQRRN